MGRPAVPDPVAPVLLALAAILAGAKLGGDLAERIGQPAVLGELVVGILLGNLDLVGVPWFRGVASDRTIDVLARLGVVLLLFEVGLVILVVVAGVITSAERGSGVSYGAVGVIVAKALVFLGGALVLGVAVSPRLFALAGRLRGSGLLLTTALVFCFMLAYLASAVGLAAIVGAYAAGLVLEEAHYVDVARQDERRLGDLVRPIGTLLVPVFFVLMGMRVELRSFAHPDVLGLALLLTLAAIAGKQACALGGLGAPLDRLSIGIGMIPRGAVGLIFANLGLSLTLHGERIVSPAIFSGLVIMVVLTTLITPPALKWSLARPAG